MDKPQLEIVTPDRLLLRESVDEVRSAMVATSASCRACTVDHRDADRRDLLSSRKSGPLGRGAGLNAGPDRVTILAEKAEKAEEIDLKRAQSAKERAENVSAIYKIEVDLTSRAGELAAPSRAFMSSKHSSE
jgi:F-type H+-transporting ATPase subunit epsilon